RKFKGRGELMTTTKVAVDFSSVERMLPVLECLAKGESPAYEEVSDLLATPGMRTWFQHVQRYGGRLDEVIYRDILKSVLGECDRRGHGVDWLRKNLHRSDAMRRVLTELQQLDLNVLCDQAYALANKHLTEPFAEPVNLYFMCSTRGSTIVYDRTMVMDIADFEDPAQQPLPIDYILSTFAHEVFHMGRDKILAHRPEPTGAGVRLIHQLLGMLWEEGIATYLFSQPFSQQQDGWFGIWDDPDPTVDTVVEIIEQAWAGSPDEAGLMRRIMGLFGLEGYVLGTRMCQAIADVLGRGGLDQCAASHYCFPAVYNLAVDQGVLGLPKFPEEVASRLMEIDPAR
ncbi:MAG: DUF5700 domain-containing putative Zn-dependent protease, partial [Bacillota bacterium]